MAPCAPSSSFRAWKPPAWRRHRPCRCGTLRTRAPSPPRRPSARSEAPMRFSSAGNTRALLGSGVGAAHLAGLRPRLRLRLLSFFVTALHAQAAGSGHEARLRGRGSWCCGCRAALAATACTGATHRAARLLVRLFVRLLVRLFVLARPAKEVAAPPAVARGRWPASCSRNALGHGARRASASMRAPGAHPALQPFFGSRRCSTPTAARSWPLPRLTRTAHLRLATCGSPPPPQRPPPPSPRPAGVPTPSARSHHRASWLRSGQRAVPASVSTIFVQT